MKEFSVEIEEYQAFIYSIFVPRGEECSYLEGENVLGVVQVCAQEEPPLKELENSDVPFLTVSSAARPEDKFSEIWLSSRPVKYERVGNYRFGHDGRNLFGSTFFCDGESGQSLDLLSEERYLALFRHLNRLAYPHLFRMWNYIPRINHEEAELERYRAFCLGRNRAFEKTFKNFAAELPAATGIATSLTNKVEIGFLAHSNRQAIHLENPRQTPAYQYPARYGPKPPSFARATYMPRGGGRFELYVSGTASIIGSQSVHPHDARNQCETALENIELLIGQENLANYNLAHSFDLRDMDSLKIHYRYQSDLPIIQEICEKRFSAQSQRVYIHGDICRSDLLVEIEGMIQSEKARQLPRVERYLEKSN